MDIHATNSASSLEAPPQSFSTRMSESDYERERARLRGLYADSRKEAGARYEQALAKLFHVSGWTQQELARKEGKTKGRITHPRFLGAD